jgi:hypothetical protein
MLNVRCETSSTNKQGKTLYHIQASTDDGDEDLLQMRFSELHLFAADLQKNSDVPIPAFPSKFVTSNRREKLDTFFSELSVHPAPAVQCAFGDFLIRSLAATKAKRNPQDTSGNSRGLQRFRDLKQESPPVLQSSPAPASSRAAYNT